MGEFTGQNCNITTIEKREDMVSAAEKYREDPFQRQDKYN